MVGKNARWLDRERRGRLSFLGEDNIKNLSAVKNLMAMGKAGTPLYLKANDPAGFDKGLGIKIHVLGPPSVDQWAKVATQADDRPECGAGQRAGEQHPDLVVGAAQPASG